MVHLCKRNICRIWNTIDKSDFEAFSRPFKIAKISIKKIFKKSVYEHNEKQLTEKLSLNNDSSKLFLYSKLKSDIKLEEYLKSERNFKNCWQNFVLKVIIT